ncbi:MAG: polysaccharide pyruvyl transferase family protein [Paludibacteraceae bacterium]|nr:polysaccharide pyruvyl transferase family protein [Paludibacteraceae bacterium]
MKNILYMTGAVINAGDFLIEKRMIALLTKFMPDIKITKTCRVGISYDDRLDYLNSFDAIIFAGGPIYQNSIYPKAIPFVSMENLERIETPLFFLGGGCRGREEGVYNPIRSISAETFTFFQKGIKNGVPLGCRDILTYRFLKRQGFENVLMTGCPAWYSLEHINSVEINKHKNSKMKICVSEPAKVSNLPIMERLIERLRKEWPTAEILLVIHRENKKNFEATLQRMKEKYGIQSVVIRDSSEGFNVYDDCDLHIGFRVHAHIYNLSIRNVTFLLNEDIRGFGVNQTLGLENINIQQSRNYQKHLFGKYFLGKRDSENPDIVVNHVMDSIDQEERNGHKAFTDAYSRMKDTFNVMKSHIGQICEKIISE